MDNRICFNEVSRLRTTDLLIAKMICTRKLSQYRALKLASVTLLGIFGSHIAKVLYATTGVMGIMEHVSIVLGLYCGFGFLLFNYREANATARKELICDLLSLRMNRAGGKS